MASATGGYATNVIYGWESTFGTVSSSLNKNFGQGVKVTTFDLDNSNELIYGLGSQSAQKSHAKEFKGAFSLEFVLSDPWWLRSVLGAAPATTGAGPYTHTWNSSQGLSNTLSSFSMVVADDMDTDSDKTLLGCVVNSATITAAVGETIKVKLDGVFANFSKDASLTSPVSPVEEPFAFQEATLEFPDSTTLSDVQNFELTITRNTELIWGLGSRFAQKQVAKQREIGMKIDMIYTQDSDLLDDFLGSTTVPSTTSPAEVATLQLTVTNGLSTTNERSYTINLASLVVDKVSMPRSIEETNKISADLRARTFTSAIVVNNTATAL
jgi:hypothetical protein